MSKDLERKNEKLEKSNEKLEKQNKKLKKKNKAGGKIILFLLLVIVILAAVIFFLDPFGWGIGPNAKSGTAGGAAPADTQQSTVSVIAETDAAPAETEPPVTVISVTVSGSTYLLDSAEATVDKIVKAAGNAEGDVIVEVKDDSATKNAMDMLTTAFEAAKIPYTIK